MTPDMITRMAALAALEAEVMSNVAYLEGMKVANEIRRQAGQTVAYDEDAFAYVANTLAMLGERMTLV